MGTADNQGETEDDVWTDHRHLGYKHWDPKLDRDQRSSVPSKAHRTRSPLLNRVLGDSTAPQTGSHGSAVDFVLRLGSEHEEMPPDLDGAHATVASSVHASPACHGADDDEPKAAACVLASAPKQDPEHFHESLSEMPRSGRPIEPEAGGTTATDAGRVAALPVSNGISPQASLCPDAHEHAISPQAARAHAGRATDQRPPADSLSPYAIASEPRINGGTASQFASLSEASAPSSVRSRLAQTLGPDGPLPLTERMHAPHHTQARRAWAAPPTSHHVTPELIPRPARPLSPASASGSTCGSASALVGPSSVVGAPTPLAAAPSDAGAPPPGRWSRAVPHPTTSQSAHLPAMLAERMEASGDSAEAQHEATANVKPMASEEQPPALRGWPGLGSPAADDQVETKEDEVDATDQLARVTGPGRPTQQGYDALDPEDNTVPQSSQQGAQPSVDNAVVTTGTRLDGHGNSLNGLRSPERLPAVELRPAEQKAVELEAAEARRANAATSSSMAGAAEQDAGLRDWSSDAGDGDGQPTQGSPAEGPRHNVTAPDAAATSAGMSNAVVAQPDSDAMPAPASARSQESVSGAAENLANVATAQVAPHANALVVSASAQTRVDAAAASRDTSQVTRTCMHLDSSTAACEARRDPSASAIRPMLAVGPVLSRMASQQGAVALAERPHERASASSYEAQRPDVCQLEEAPAMSIPLAGASERHASHHQTESHHAFYQGDPPNAPTQPYLDGPGTGMSCGLMEVGSSPNLDESRIGDHETASGITVEEAHGSDWAPPYEGEQEGQQRSVSALPRSGAGHPEVATATAQGCMSMPVEVRVASSGPDPDADESADALDNGQGAAHACGANHPSDESDDSYVGHDSIVPSKPLFATTDTGECADGSVVFVLGSRKSVPALEAAASEESQVSGNSRSQGKAPRGSPQSMSPLPTIDPRFMNRSHMQ